MQARPGGIGIALLLIGTLLFSGSVCAAELSYDDYVAQAKAGKVDIDYTAFRLAYTSSPKYASSEWTVRELRAAMRRAHQEGDCTTAMGRAADIFEVNFVNIDAHLIAAMCHKKAGNPERERQEATMFRGIVSSVLRSGDGKSPETAFVVISIDEEYAAMQAIGVRLERQSLVSHGGSDFDRIEGKRLDSGEAITLYFNVDRPLRRSRPSRQ